MFMKKNSNRQGTLAFINFEKTLYFAAGAKQSIAGAQTWEQGPPSDSVKFFVCVSFPL